MYLHKKFIKTKIDGENFRHTHLYQKLFFKRFLKLSTLLKIAILFGKSKGVF